MLNMQELVEYFSKIHSPKDKEGFRKALAMEKELASRARQEFEVETNKVTILGIHPGGYEMCLWGDDLLSTFPGTYALCAKCHGKRILRFYGEWQSHWHCLDCKEEVFAIDAGTLLPGPHLD